MAYQMYINGQWCEAQDGGRSPVLNPATDEVVTEVPYGGREDARQALEAAAVAFETWSRMTPHDRAPYLKEITRLMKERVELIAEAMTLEMGKPLAESRGETLASAEFFEWYGEEAKRLYGRLIPSHWPQKRLFTIRQPVGVCAAIAPWNFPVLLPVRKIAPAIAAGCTMVARPATQTPLSLARVFECIADSGLPAGVANLVTGLATELCEEFMTNRLCAKVGFTGSTEVGKMLLRQSADQVKRLTLELGGHAPVLIFADAEPDKMLQIAMTKFRNNGQVCISPSRYYVHEDVVAEFTEKVVGRVKALRLGNGLEEGIDLGPMASKRERDRVLELLEDARGKGARILCGGKVPPHLTKGSFIEPTVVDQVTNDMRLMEEEPFAPILPIIPFKEEDDVIAQANSTRYGLAAYVCTASISRGVRVAEALKAGIVGLNDSTPATFEAPFGGMKESGIGREGGIEGIEPYVETKYIAVGL